MTRQIHLFALVAALLSGCATTLPDSWIAPEALRMPNRIQVHIPAAVVMNKDDLRDDLMTDSVGFREWLKPILKEQICLAARIDSIDWVDSLEVVRDTTAPGWQSSRFERPAKRGGRGWILVFSELRTAHSTMPGQVVDGIRTQTEVLQMTASYLLLDLGSGRNMAAGYAVVGSPFRLRTDRSNWEDAAAALGQRIGERLPRR